VRIREPELGVADEQKHDIHMYPNGTLCLYWPQEQPWNDSMSLHDTIVPWVAEWLVYYEYYQETGRWVGPEAGARKS